MLLRLLAYGLFGWCAEIVWTALYDFASGTLPEAGGAIARRQMVRGERWRLAGHTYLWMLPIYGSAALLFEPLHDALRALPLVVRGLAYAAGIFAVEAAAGLLLRRLTGRCPWDYSYARTHIGGVIRLDYTPVWFVFGLALERLHDALVTLEPLLRAAAW